VIEQTKCDDVFIQTRQSKNESVPNCECTLKSNFLQTSKTWLKFSNFVICLSGFILNCDTDDTSVSRLWDCYSEWFTLPSTLSYSAASDCRYTKLVWLSLTWNKNKNIFKFTI